jgi:hemolysin III
MTLLPTASAATAAPDADTAQLYDMRRGVHYTKPALRGWQHLIWFAFSLLAGTLVLARTHGDTRITALAIYTATVSGLFGISALYHRGTWSPAASRLLQRLDHVMIFFLIAGTATPGFLLATPGVLGRVLLAAMWAITLISAAVHLCWMTAPEKLVGLVFLLLGWAAGASVPAVWSHFGAAPAILLVAGGLLYTLGALSYHRRSPDPHPAVFGYHEVFHAYVCAAATFQYVAIAVFLS